MRVNEANLRAYLDGELPEPERMLVERHLARSSRAQAALAQLRRDRDLVNRAMDQLAPAASTISPAWLVLKQLRSGTISSEQSAPGRRGLPSKEATSSTWESPGLLGELKAVFSPLHPKRRQPMTQSILSKRLSLVATLALVALVIAGALFLPVDRVLQLGGRLSAFLDGELVDSARLDPKPDQKQPGAVSTTAISATNVIVALQPISQGVVIAPGMVGLREWPANNLPPRAMLDEADVIGKVTRMPIIQGQVMVSEMLLDRSQTVNYELKDIRQLTPCENKGQRTLFIRVQDSEGQGLNDVPVKILWQAAPEESVVLDTESIEGEPGRLEFEMRPGVYAVEIAQGISQVVTVNTAHFEAEELCNGGPGNGPNLGSYEIIFEQVEPVPIGRAVDPGYGYGFQADPHGDTAANIEHLQALGFGWAKLRMPWKEVEPGQGRYSWQPWDEVINAYAAADIRVLLNIVHTPDWARPDDDDRSVEGLPADPATYADFAARVAERYQGRVQAIEVWNEQNLWYKVGGKGRMDAAGYVRLLQPAYKAIKKTNPDMIVVGGGLSPAGNVGDLAVDDFDYLQAMYDSGVKGYLDALAAHPRGFNCPALADWRSVTPEEAAADPSHGVFRDRHHSWCFLGTMLGYREIMTANDDGDTPVWVTEFGWAVADETIPGFEYARDNTPEEQAQWIIEAYDWAEEQDWIGPLFLWNLDYGLTAPGTELAMFGLLDTPAYEALLERRQQRLGQSAIASVPDVAFCPSTPRPPEASIRFSSPALGFALEYPEDWHKKETRNFVIFSPSAGGLDPDTLVDVALWVGKVPENAPVNTGELLKATQAGFPAGAELMTEGPIEIGQETWVSQMIRFNEANLCGQAVATLAATVEGGQGYYLVVVAPAEAWNDMQPVFQDMLDTFRFLP